MPNRKSLTERRLLERLSIATQAAGIFVWDFDWKTGTIVWDESRIGKATTNRHYGWELGSELFKWVHPEDLNIGRRSMAEALAQGSPDASFRYRLRLADGSIRHIQAFARTQTDAAGEPARSIGVSWDITDEVESAERLRINAEKERNLLEHLSIAAHAAGIECWEYDYTLGHFTWFHGLDDTLRGPSDDPAVIGKRVIGTILPEDSRAVLEATEKALAEGADRLTCRMRRSTPDGQLRHLMLYQRFVRDASGRALRALGAARDITLEIEATERFRLQAEALHDAQRRLERAALSVHQGLWETDLVNHRHWASASYCALLGYEPEELSLDTLAKVNALIHPEELRVVMNERLDDLPFEREMRLRHKDGSYRWFVVRSVIERNAQREPVRILGSIQDIHRQKQVEDELKEARLRFERAIRGTQDGLWEWDLRREQLWVSPRYEAILGYTEAELCGSGTPDRLVHPDDLESYRRVQRAHFAEGAPFDVEVRMRTSVGAYRWMRMRGEAERDGAGQPLRLAGSIQDVTDARAARDALIQASEAAQAASRSKSAFLANMSHEIRTPMNGILGMTSLLLGTRLDAEQKSFADAIRTSADSLLAVINDVLDFSKIEAGRLAIESIDFDLPDCIEEVRTILAFQAEAKHLRLEVRVQPQVPRRVLGDPQRVRQCLINLVNNAIKFTAAGSVALEVSLQEQRDGCAHVRFEVRDSGIGIAREVLPTLFQPFVQADSSTTRHFGGSGLGLSIVRRLIEMMGGAVGVESTLGLGSTFWFHLPLPIAPARNAADSGAARRPRARSAEDRLARGAGRPYRGEVLLVEDNLVNQKVAQGFLERLGCRVTVAVNGLQAVQAFARGHFHLVLLDLQMPLMDGYTATACLRKLGEGRGRTPIVALTASALRGQRERCIEAGMDDLITKPLDAARLEKVLENFGLTPRPLPEPLPSSNAEAAPPAVDLAALEQVTGDDALFQRELVQAFVATSAELLAELTACAARGERGNAARAAHSLKGASANIHAAGLATRCAQLETRCQGLEDGELMRAVAELATECERVVLELQGFADRSSARAQSNA